VKSTASRHDNTNLRELCEDTNLVDDTKRITMTQTIRNHPFMTTNKLNNSSNTLNTVTFVAINKTNIYIMSHHTCIEMKIVHKNNKLIA